MARSAITVRHFSTRTEDTYVDWVCRFILFHDKRHPRDLGATEVAAFLTHLALTVVWRRPPRTRRRRRCCSYTARSSRLKCVGSTRSSTSDLSRPAQCSLTLRLAWPLTSYETFSRSASDALARRHHAPDDVAAAVQTGNSQTDLRRSDLRVRCRQWVVSSRSPPRPGRQQSVFCCPTLRRRERQHLADAPRSRQFRRVSGGAVG